MTSRSVPPIRLAVLLAIVVVVAACRADQASLPPPQSASPAPPGTSPSASPSVAPSPSPTPSATPSAAPTPSATASTSPSGGFDQGAAEAYCTTSGGTVVERVATWNTNDDSSNWLALAGRLRLCEFIEGTGDEATSISVDLVTLYSTQPTLAAVAYLSKVPLDVPPGSGNPATYQCHEVLGGASEFGNTAAGGGWVAVDDADLEVVALCVFADRSAIDEWGIVYFADGTIRGADLSKLFRYQPGLRLPAMFESVDG